MRRFEITRWFLAAVMAVSCGSAARAQEACTGDCNTSGDVTVDEILKGVNIALGTAELSVCEKFDSSGDGQVTVDEIVGAVTFALEGCPMGGEGLGVRHFSLNPTSSKMEILGLPLQLVSTKFEGYMDLEAGPVGSDGLNHLNLVGISEYFSISLRPPIGNPLTICLKPVVDQLPMLDIGGLACGPYDRAGVEIAQDHNTNDVDPTCSEGTPDKNPAHEGVCNGPFAPTILTGDPGVGAVAITPDPETLMGGLQFEVITENALPCGDEGLSGTPAPFVLSTGISRAIVIDRDNVAGTQLKGERKGENFDCAAWTEEDGPGKLVFLAPLLDFPAGPLGSLDIVTAFTLDD